MPLGDFETPFYLETSYTPQQSLRLMVALRYVGYLAFGALFLSIAGALFLQYQAGQLRSNFLNNAEQLANSIAQLSEQEEGSTLLFQLSIPSGMSIEFENESLLAFFDGKQENFSVGTVVSGPPLTAGDYSLLLSKISTGVKVDVQG